MTINEAISKRINDICNQTGFNICQACLGGGKSPSSIYDLMKGRTKCPKVSTVQSFCEGVGMTLAQFFDSPYFENLDEE